MWWADRLAAAADPHELAACAGRLAALGPAAVPATVGLLSSPRQDVRVAGAAILAQVRGADATEALLRALFDSDLDVRLSAATALATRADPALIERLFSIVVGPAAHAAMAAIVVVERAPDSAGAGIHRLLELTRRADLAPVVRAQAIDSIGRRRDPAAVPVLRSLLNDASPIEEPPLGVQRDLRLSEFVAEAQAVAAAPETTAAPTTIADVAAEALVAILRRDCGYRRGLPPNEWRRAIECLRADPPADEPPER